MHMGSGIQLSTEGVCEYDQSVAWSKESPRNEMHMGSKKVMRAFTRNVKGAFTEQENPQKESLDSWCIVMPPRVCHCAFVR